ncbi:hypothetical protein CKM354_000429400 [Cercospora kikuchii]|uniref:Uncharacterized protein n=1 Tax=Cercospora kikuchii TaxID=84275 RepID=A0A9P3CJL2_9PEZI|nr:uncharacterized protein CKM354_000429400 [Cercospora kikuchii]GIZ40975.1 hypothetical protein CKM354_000429400 [Cercospora kikuchii]
MPSPRTSPAMRPTSPLSPGYKNSGHFDGFQSPPQRPMHSRTSSGQHHHHSQQQQRRAPSNSLRLPSLPRFHPANFPSAQSSLNSTPDVNSHASSPQPPMSPRQYQRLYNDAQKQLYFNHRELFSTAVGGKPVSPRLQPLGSPGPVTPLELEGEEGYLIAGARSMNASAATPSDVAEKMAKAEVQRQRTSETGSLRQSSR